MQYSPHNYVMTLLKTHFFPKTLHHMKKIFCQAMIYDCRGISDSDSTSRLPLKIEEIAKTKCPLGKSLYSHRNVIQREFDKSEMLRFAQIYNQ